MNGASINGGDSTGTANNRIKLGLSNDLQIYHDGSHSYVADSGTGNLYIQSNHLNIDTDHGEEMVNCIKDGAVQLYYDNSKKFETDSNGVTVTGRILSLDNGANGIQSRATNTQTTDTNRAFKVRNNSDTDTFSISYKGNVFLPDNNKINFGASNDLQIYHDGSQSVIKDSGTGQLLIQGENTIAFTNADQSENYARLLKDGAVEPYHDITKRFETSR